MDNHSVPTTKMSSTLEPDDACDLRYQSVASSACDSGIFGSLDCSSYGSGKSRFGSINRIGDSTTNLMERLTKLNISPKEQRRKVPDARDESEASYKGSVTLPQFRTQTVEMTSLCGPFSQTYPGIDPFHQDEDGDTQLHLSIIQPNPSLAIRLIEIGQFTDQLDVQNDHQQTPLHLAVITDQPHLVRALVLSGASLTVRDKQGNNPLHLACKLGHAQCVERLTAPPSVEEVQYVWRERQKKGLATRTMNCMLSNDFSLLNYEGDSCLQLALSSAAESKFQILDYLLKTCGADINVQEGKCGFTLLHHAVRSRDLDAAQFLLANPNIAVNQCCYNGYTPLDFAFSQLHNQLADLLLCYGALSFGGLSSSETDAHQDIDFDDLVIAGSCPKAESFRR